MCVDCVVPPLDDDVRISCRSTTVRFTLKLENDDAQRVSVLAREMSNEATTTLAAARRLFLFRRGF